MATDSMNILKTRNRGVSLRYFTAGRDALRPGEAFFQKSLQAVMPTEERFDVVDADDRVVGSEFRSVVHRDGLSHRAVHIFVFNAKGELYLQRRSMNKDSAPGKWVSSCSGHVDSGEDYDTAALRELGEEIGLYDPIEMERVFKEPACRPTGNEFVWVYRCHSEGPFILDPEEVSDGQWIEVDALNRWIEERPRDFAWSFTHLWMKYQERTLHRASARQA